MSESNLEKYLNSVAAKQHQGAEAFFQGDITDIGNSTDIHVFFDEIKKDFFVLELATLKVLAKCVSSKTKAISTHQLTSVTPKALTRKHIDN